MTGQIGDLVVAVADGCVEIVDTSVNADDMRGNDHPWVRIHNDQQLRAMIEALTAIANVGLRP